MRIVYSSVKFYDLFGLVSGHFICRQLVSAVAAVAISDHSLTNLLYSGLNGPEQRRKEFNDVHKIVISYKRRFAENVAYLVAIQCVRQLHFISVYIFYLQK